MTEDGHWTLPEEEELSENSLINFQRVLFPFQRNMGSYFFWMLMFSDIFLIFLLNRMFFSLTVLFTLIVGL
jgi:hypothetical protein